MKHLSTVIALLSTLFSTASCAQGKADKATETKETSSMKTGKKVLVAFFSHTSENYAVGYITKGNTHIIAEMKENPCMITILETYANQEAYERHIKSAHFLKYKQGTLHMVKSLVLSDQTPLNPESRIKNFIQ